ncbi:hypothetical protein FRC10_010211, partial [Ceratobasidium sp. 414]
MKPSVEVPEPRVMTYVQRFTPIPDSPSPTSGFYGVCKLPSEQGVPQLEVIAASQIARSCPLEPQIKEKTGQGVDGTQSLDYYDRFYINKYRIPDDF